MLKLRADGAGVPIFAACQPDVGSDTVAIAEDLHSPLGQPYLHFLLEVLAGNAVEHLFHGDMVVVLYRGSFPQGKLIGGIRQREQVHFFFFLKTAFAASWFLLEWPAVEFLQFLPDCLIQIAQGEKCGVSQGSGKSVFPQCRPPPSWRPLSAS